MNVLVTGANGQLGMSLRRLAAGAPDRYIFTDINTVQGYETLYLDITNIEAVRITCDSEQVDAIINCAGYTNVDGAEDDVQMSDLLNRQAPEILASVAKERGAVLIHISTDYVFDGKTPHPYTESASPNPLNVYGTTKLAGDRCVAESGCRYLIFRTSWMYSPYGKNFARAMLRLFHEKPVISVVYDQVGSPTYAPDLAAFIVEIIASGKIFRNSGIFNYSSEGAVSWYDFAKAIHRLSGASCEVVPCLTEEYSSKVERPRYSVLDKSKVKSVFGVKIPYWEKSLERFFKDIK